MHQHLRFNVLSSKTNEWQPILATEYIGTMYMVYIKFCEKFCFSQEETNNIKCKFYIQNYRGSIKMGLGDVEKISITSEKKDGLDFILNIPVVPFHNCNESDEKTLSFPPIKPGNTTFETEVYYKELPCCIFDPNNLKESKFIHPLYCFREGDDMHHIYYKKNITNTEDEIVDSEITGGHYDSNRLKDEGQASITDVKILERKNLDDEMMVFTGSQNSPTCDAKRSDII